MSRADEYFRDAMSRILSEGFSDEGFGVRPKWPDGTPAHTKKTFSYVTRYDLSEEFPATTLRRQAFKTCMKELVWMWCKKSNRISDLGAHIWDAWALPDGTIGKTYSYQLAKPYDLPQGRMDQVEALIRTLRSDPMSRRMIVTMWNPADLREMPLAPCVYETVWDVSGGRLNMLLIQRSGDALAAGAPGGYDEMQYAALQCAVAQCVGLRPGEFCHVCANLHIYDRHEAAIRAMLEREPRPGPKLRINPEIKELSDFSADDFELIGYDPWPSMPFEVAE